MISRLVARPFHGRHLLAALLVAFTVAACGDLGEESPLAPDSAPEQVSQPAPLTMQDFGPAIAAADRYTAALMRNPNIVGTGVGLNEDGKPSVRLFLVTEYFEGLPDELDDVPVSTAVTGQFWARSVDRTARTRPAPIGFSVGHPDITAGTLGARVKDGTGVFILSNNHVLANSNDGNIGDSALQPGPHDGGSDPEDQIGELADYYPIDFDGGDNTMDAAIASVDGADVSGSTPEEEGYGAPSTTPVDPALDADVQKYGRTTGHTLGTVEEINVTVTVCFAGFPFCTKSATFVEQFTITPGDFSDGGDSGSLIVTQGNNHPMGLLFAGSDTRTIANPIKVVLTYFGIEIDPTDPGDSGDPGDPDPVGPTASFTYSCTELSCDFDGSASTAGDEPIASYDWDFGDGSTGTGEFVSHTYGADDTYTVTLTVTDGAGLQDSDSQNVTVAADEEPEEGTLSIDQFEVNARSTGPWRRADVTWTVSHSGGGLASVTTELLVGTDVVDSQTSSVSGSEASGEHDLRVRNQTPDEVRITVTDVDGNTVSDTKPYN